MQAGQWYEISRSTWHKNSGMSAVAHIARQNAKQPTWNVKLKTKSKGVQECALQTHSLA